jgi:hypothetical protein
MANITFNVALLYSNKRNNTPAGYASPSPMALSYSREKSYNQNQGYSFVVLHSEANKTKLSSIEVGVVTKIVLAAEKSFDLMPALKQSTMRAELGNSIPGATVSFEFSIEDGIEAITVATSTTTFNVYLTDGAIIQFYKEHEIIVAPPCANIDDLMVSSSLLKAAVEAGNDQGFFNGLSYYAPTYIAKRRVNRVSGESIETVTFSLLVYGEAGNNSELQREAIVDYITANTKLPITGWKQVYPSLWVSRINVVVPDWWSVAIQPTAMRDIIYSCGRNNQDVNEFVSRYLPQADMSKDSYRSTFPMPYKGIEVTVIFPTLTETGKLTDFHYEYPDYISVGPMEREFNYMCPKTKGVALFLLKAVELAEDTSKKRTNPEKWLNFHVSEKRGATFVVGIWDNSTWEVLVK